MLQDLHTHTTYCDGKNSPEEMVLSAIEKGLDRIGICTHGYTDFDESYCIPHEEYGKFQDEINALKEKYADKIDVLCGVEQDVFSNTETEGFDYDLFFRSYAELWRGVNTLQMEKYFAIDVHPLNFLRANVTLQQFDEFLATYDIHEGDGMYLAAGQRISVW